MIFNSIVNRFRSFLSSERCPRRLALSVALSVFIAFSPFVGFHTAMVVLFSWIFALNASLLLAISMCVNNPWTMIPIYATDHLVGDKIFHLLGINGMELNPSWIASCNAWIAKNTGMNGINLWAFLVGGNIVSILLALLIYVCMRYLMVERVGTQRS